MTRPESLFFQHYNRIFIVKENDKNTNLPIIFLYLFPNALDKIEALPVQSNVEIPPLKMSMITQLHTSSLLLVLLYPL